MQDEPRSRYLNRSGILKLLTDEEIAQVSTGHAAVCLSEGDEYLDLGDLEHGVRQAHGTAISMRRVLPKKAVPADTWSDILVQLSMLRVARPESEASQVVRTPIHSQHVAMFTRSADDLAASK